MNRLQTCGITQWRRLAFGVGLAAAACLGTTAHLPAAVVDNFDAAPAMTLFQAEARGVSGAAEAAPAGGSGKAEKLSWSAQHASFVELYYARDVALPGTTETLAGKLRLKLCSDTPNVLWLVAVRIKDAKDEIFQFDVPVKVAAPGTWQEVVIPVAPGAQRSSWGGGKTGQMQGPLRLTGYAFGLNEAAPAGALWLDDAAWENAAAKALPGPAAMGEYRLEDAHLLEPFWRSRTGYGESALFVQEKADSAATGCLLFKPARILRVRNARTGELYEAGRDYEVDAGGRRLVRTPASRIPFMKTQDFYKPKGAKQAIRQKADDPETWLIYQEQGFQDKQVEVDYVRDEEWQGMVPQYAGDLLGRAVAKLKRKEKLSIAIIGDSISTGANASSKAYPPHMPPYPVLLARQLEALHGGQVELLNVAKAGTMADGGLKEVPAVLAAKPDLVVIAYGGNDVATRNAAKYAENVGRIVDAVRAGAPEAEFILVTSSRTHPEWSWTPAAEFPKYREALAAVAMEKHAALADMTLLWTHILERKRFYDLTGNGVNHPNDFGHRLYAELFLALLVNANELPAAPRPE